MTAHIFRTLVLILLPSVLMAQSIDFSVSSPTSNNNSSTFLLEKGELSVNSNMLHFRRTGSTVNDFEAFGISPDNSVVSLLKRTQEGGEVVLLNSTGDTLNTYATGPLANDDPSLALYPSNSGDVLIRDNIANFTFYDTFGDIKTNMSSSSGSKEGEAISEVAMSTGGETVVIYNPKIKRDGNLGSKAEVKLPGGEFKNIFFSRDRYIREIKVSDDGQLVVLITVKQGTDDQVLIMDEFGNELNRITSEETLIGAAISADGENLTLYSSGRVMVYETLGNDRLQSVSLRSPVFHVNYFNDDSILLILTGSYSERIGVMQNVEFKAVDLAKPAITSKEYPEELGFNKALSPRFVRVSKDTYQFKGASKRVTIETNF